MNRKQTSFDLLDAYLQGELSGESLARFEAKMKTDAELAAFVERQQTIRKVASDDQRRAFTQTVRKIVQQHRVLWHRRLLHKIFGPWRINIPSLIPEKYALPAGATLLLVAVCAALWHFFAPQPSGKKNLPGKQLSALFDSTNLKIPSVEMGAKMDTFKLTGGHLFKAKKYGDAIPYFEKALQNDPADLDIRLLLGISRMEIGRHEAALKDFRKIIVAEGVDADAAWLGIAEVRRRNQEWDKSLAALQAVETFSLRKQTNLEKAKQMQKEIEEARAK